MVGIFSLRWVSLIGIPLMIGEFLFLGGMASVGRQQLTGAHAFLGCCLLIACVLRATAFYRFPLALPFRPVNILERTKISTCSCGKKRTGIRTALRNRCIR